MKVPRNCLSGSWEGTRVAPAHTSPVIPACFCELRDFNLYRFPFQAGAAWRLENDCWGACPRAENVEGPAPNVHRLSDFGKAPAVLPAPQLLINDAGNKHRRSKKRKAF